MRADSRGREPQTLPQGKHPDLLPLPPPPSPRFGAAPGLCIALPGPSAAGGKSPGSPSLSSEHLGLAQLEAGQPLPSRLPLGLSQPAVRRRAGRAWGKATEPSPLSFPLQGWGGAACTPRVCWASLREPAAARSRGGELRLAWAVAAVELVRFPKCRLGSGCPPCFSFPPPRC